MDLTEQPVTESFRRHPWELSRRFFLCRLLRIFGLDRTPVRVLDAGAGDGWLGAEVLRTLPVGSALLSWDPYYTILPSASGQHRFVKVLEKNECCGLLLLLDVLEHVEEPRSWLNELVAAHLAPHGHVVISVPAWPNLYGHHDRALQHHRRFHPAEIRCLLKEAGLNLICHGGLFVSLLPVRHFTNLMVRFQRTSPPTAPLQLTWHWGGLTQVTVAALLNLDSCLALALARRKIAIPGLSWWALCQKK